MVITCEILHKVRPSIVSTGRWPDVSTIMNLSKMSMPLRASMIHGISIPFSFRLRGERHIRRDIDTRLQKEGHHWRRISLNDYVSSHEKRHVVEPPQCLFHRNQSIGCYCFPLSVSQQDASNVMRQRYIERAVLGTAPMLKSTTDMETIDIPLSMKPNPMSIEKTDLGITYRSTLADEIQKMRTSFQKNPKYIENDTLPTGLGRKSAIGITYKRFQSKNPRPLCSNTSNPLQFPTKTQQSLIVKDRPPIQQPHLVLTWKAVKRNQASSRR
jgi:hypothetical protein